MLVVLTISHIASLHLEMSDMLWQNVNWHGCKIKVILHFGKNTMPLRNWRGMLIRLGTFLGLRIWWRLGSQMHAQICLSLIKNLLYPFCWKLVDPRVHVDLVVRINITASATNQISVICLWPDALLTAWHFHDFCKFKWKRQYKQQEHIVICLMPQSSVLSSLQAFVSEYVIVSEHFVSKSDIPD